MSEERTEECSKCGHAYSANGGYGKEVVHGNWRCFKCIKRKGGK